MLFTVVLVEISVCSCFSHLAPILAATKMNTLLALTNLQVPREEFTRTVVGLPATELLTLRTCLFAEEARELNLTHPQDVLVSRRSSAVRPITLSMLWR